MLFPEKCFNFGEKDHISGKFLGVSGKIYSYLGKIGVCPTAGKFVAHAPDFH